MTQHQSAVPPLKFLHLEDSGADAELIRAVLVAEWSNCEVVRVEAEKEFEAMLLRDRFDLILSDFSMPGYSGLKALKLARELKPAIPFVFLSGTIGEENAVESLKRGATDYVIKDRMARLVPAIRRALDEVAEHQARRHAERRLREQAGLLDKARDAIVVTDMDRRIVYWNRGAQNVFGWSATEAVGQLARDLFGPDAVQEFQAVPIAGSPDEWQGEVSVKNKKGEDRALKYSVTVIHDDNGAPQSRLIISTDITAQKEMEKQFLRAQRLESLGMLAAGIAHDLNNVLAPVLMGAPLLRLRAEHPSDIRVIEAIEKSAERGAGLVRQILSFAHGSTGNKTVIQVRHLLRDITDLIKETFPKSIRLNTEVFGDLWTIEGNSTQIHQIMLNLCVNARDAMPEGGTLTLRAENKVLDAAAAESILGASPGSFVCLEVTDTGTGISPEVLALIWDPFFTTKGEGKGTGLGLATVRGIVASHGGVTVVDSVVGRGTTFRVYLPSTEESAKGNPKFSTAPFLSRGQGELVLVVDDETAISSLVKTVLTRNGYRVLVASNGAEAVSLFAARVTEFVLVVTDMNMPGLNGIGLAHALQRFNPAIKILLMSGAGDELPAEFSAVPGGMIRKPFTVDDLLSHVRQRLEARSPGDLSFV